MGRMSLCLGDFSDGRFATNAHVVPKAPHARNDRNSKEQLTFVTKPIMFNFVNIHFAR